MLQFSLVSVVLGQHHLQGLQSEECTLSQRNMVRPGRSFSHVQQYPHGNLTNGLTDQIAATLWPKKKL